MRNKEIVPADYPERIKKIRSNRSLTQISLAQVLGVSYVTVNRWENGQSRPSTLAWQKIRQIETQAQTQPSLPTAEHATIKLPTEALDFQSSPEVVRVVTEAERLRRGHIANPSFATEVSLIEPLPHQRIAVYERMLAQSRLRFLLADDAGAGKTIMTGLYIREMLSRKVLQRILIVVPAGLIGNWKRELRTLFGLTFNVARGTDARLTNPFMGPGSNQLIVSIDTLRGEQMFRRIQESNVSSYDLVVFDEAHKLSADREPDLRIHKTERYHVAEALAGIKGDSPRWSLPWSAYHLLLLTATPHMGKDYPYYFLWRLLEPQSFSTYEAFQAFPSDVRANHFIRRTKEEMVRFDETPIYPTRTSDTLGYRLTQGLQSEQELYDRMTSYLRTFYNRARILNRSAARLAMSVFQRRLASSTFAVLCSLERRLLKLDKIINALLNGQISEEDLQRAQLKLNQEAVDLYEKSTADEEQGHAGVEENEEEEEKLLGGVVSITLADLQAERGEVEQLVELASAVHAKGQESKFEKLVEVLRSPEYRNEKFLIFTEHRDTMSFLVRRLEGLGFYGKVAKIHGGMDYMERDAEVEFFKRPGGAQFLIGTDAAGEGINLQFCWLMINYDIPWNPARLEQRMGRIHRFNQKHDPVVIINLVAEDTREGLVLRVLLKKLERIRREMRSDKVFDVVGRVFSGLSIKNYMDRLLSGDDEKQLEKEIDQTLTKEKVEQVEKEEEQIYGKHDEVKKALPALRINMEQEVYRRLLPGYVQRFLQEAAPLMDLGLENNKDATFRFAPLKPHALDLLLPALDDYDPEQQDHLTVWRPSDSRSAVWVHPGEPVFEQFATVVLDRYAADALRGAVFTDVTAQESYIFYLASVAVLRAADPSLQTLSTDSALETQLVGLRQYQSGRIEECSVEELLVLRGLRDIPPAIRFFALTSHELLPTAKDFLSGKVGTHYVTIQRDRMLATLPSRSEYLARGFDFQDAELAAIRSKLNEKARQGDAHAIAELNRIKERQRSLQLQRDEALDAMRREPELVKVGEVKLIARALVVPSSDPEDKRRQNDEIEAIGMQVSTAYEQTQGAIVKDVSAPEKSRAAGLTDRPGFDLLALNPPHYERAIEVKGRAGIGEIELTDNEWAKACNLRDRYWLYVVYDCARPQPRLLRIKDPFGKLLARATGGVIINDSDIFAAAEHD